jgi:hypothetical protein
MKYTVKWNQEIVSGDIWRMGEERELTTEQFYWMEITYPGVLVQVKLERVDLSIPTPNEPPELRATTPAQQRIVTKAPVRAKSAKPAAKSAAGKRK